MLFLCFFSAKSQDCTVLPSVFGFSPSGCTLILAIFWFFR